MRMILKGVLALLVVSVAQAQPALPLPAGAATEGVGAGQPIRARDALENTRTLVDAINELHARSQELEERLSAVEARWIEASEVRTIGAGGDFANLNLAFAWLADKRLAAGAEMRFQVQVGEHNHAEPVVVDHPDASRIFIEGGGDRCVLRFAAGGLVLQSERLGGLGGLVLRGPGSAVEGTVGLTIDGGLAPIDALAITDFDVGLKVVNSGQAIAETLDLDRMGGMCAFASIHGHIRAARFEARGCRDGLIVEQNSRVDLDVVDITEVDQYAVRVRETSSVAIRGGGTVAPVAVAGDHYGLRAETGSYLYAGGTEGQPLVVRNHSNALEVSGAVFNADHLQVINARTGLGISERGYASLQSSAIQATIAYRTRRGGVFAYDSDNVVLQGCVELGDGGTLTFGAAVAAPGGVCP